MNDYLTLRQLKANYKDGILKVRYFFVGFNEGSSHAALTTAP